jgi:pimeloyl-ACP methyl ester carboxylesterase
MDYIYVAPFVVMGYLLVSLIAYRIQERFIFRPEKLPPDFEFKYKFPHEELRFEPEPGVVVSGLRFRVENAKGLVIYFHGNSRSIKGWGKFSEDFTSHGFDVVMIDYRGFGKSTGKRSEADMLHDMQVVYNHLTEKVPEQHMIVYGRSIGSGFATKVASDNKPRYLILDAPYFSFAKVVQRYLPFLPSQWVLRYHLRTDKWITRVNCHTYILHGTKDWLIPISHSQKLQELNPHKITLIRIPGGGHNNLPSFHEYHNFIRDILQY